MTPPPPGGGMDKGGGGGGARSNPLAEAGDAAAGGGPLGFNGCDCSPTSQAKGHVDNEGIRVGGSLSEF